MKTHKAKWFDEQTWLCLNHLSTVRIPANAAACWYTGCPSQRPDKGTMHHEIAIAQARATIERVRARAEENLRLQDLTTQVATVPTPATLVTVQCAVCKTDVQRRAADVARSKNGVFFCSRAHSAANRPPIEVANAARIMRQAVNTPTVNTPTVNTPVVNTPTVNTPTVKNRGSVVVDCAVCHAPLSRKPSDVKTNRIGAFFCGRAHQEQWRRQPH